MLNWACFYTPYIYDKKGGNTDPQSIWGSFRRKTENYSHEDISTQAFFSIEKLQRG